MYSFLIPQTRLKLAEALVRTAEVLGDQLEQYLDDFIDAFVNVNSADMAGAAFVFMICRESSGGGGGRVCVREAV